MLKVKILFILFVLFLSCSLSYPADLKVGSFNTGPFPCDGEMQNLYWHNEGPIRVKQITVWIGADIGIKADICTCIYRLSDITTLTCLAWDRYINPTGLHQWTQNFAPDWIELKSGDALLLQGFCDGFNGKTKSAHIAVWFWYTQE